MIDISPSDEEKLEQISQPSSLSLPSQQSLPITTYSRTKTLLGVLLLSSIMVVITIIGLKMNLSSQLAGKLGHYYTRNELVNHACDPRGQITNDSRALNTEESYEDDEQEIYEQQNQKQQQSYQANQTTNFTFNQTQLDEYFYQYKNSNITPEQFAQCYASLTKVGVYISYHFAYDQINRLFYLTLGVSVLTFAGFLHIKNKILNKLSSLVFIQSNSLLCFGLALIFQQVNGDLQPMIAVGVLILINIILIMIMDMCRCSQRIQFTTIFMATALIHFAKGFLKFPLESIPMALLFCTFAILMNGKDLNFKSSIHIFGLIQYLLFNVLETVFLDPVRKLRSFSSRQQRTIQNTTDDNRRRVHLIKSHITILGILILMYIIWVMTYYTHFINIFAKKKFEKFYLYTTDTPIMIACYILPGTLHLISSLIYQNTTLTKTKYTIVYILVIFEWIFLALLIGALTTIEITQNIIITDNKSIQYFLVLSMIGVLGSISTLYFKEIKYYQIMIPVSSVNMLAYYFDYRSVCIGLASSLVFCYYIGKYSEFLISEQNKTIEIAIEDDFITTNCLVNPIQLLSHIIQSIINKYKFQVVGYTQAHNFDNQKIKAQKTEIELIQQ